MQEKVNEIKNKIRDYVNSEIANRKERKRLKEREKRRRGSRKFGQAKLKHSKMGITSCSYAGGTAGLLLFSILIAYFTDGRAPGIIGALGLVALVLAGFGLHAAIKGMREREKNYITCKIGIACNALLVLGLTAIFLGGLL
ncbi:DUF6142 family protein [Hespellia stercorisuis]|uniref:Uncharacterized protein n=1 Tax=Hespellia stercorisuis DSM 15480 TaxID=1121950 RepID=A0A1M6T0U3_9FIRM|nr:DUF6142 family protein [Hespellia stercorisuis]SHK50565.1 hypothetical protein SAMN02745243_03094 [Hespellia stercorisuis DSM 15480]